MRIRLTDYPFNEKELDPKPTEEEKEVYIGLIIEAESFISSGEMPEEIAVMHPNGGYKVIFLYLIEQLLLLDEEAKMLTLWRWESTVKKNTEILNKGGTMSILIPRDCCEEITAVN